MNVAKMWHDAQKGQNMSKLRRPHENDTKKHQHVSKMLACLLACIEMAKNWDRIPTRFILCECTLCARCETQQMGSGPVDRKFAGGIDSNSP